MVKNTFPIKIPASKWYDGTLQNLASYAEKLSLRV